MIITNNQASQLFYKKIDTKKDREARYHVIDDCIRQLSAELVRVIRLPFTSEQKRKQILYLDSLLAAYERDLKLHE